MEKLSILIADGNTQLTSQIKNHLMSKGRIARCDVVENGKQALTKLKEVHYDVVVFDVVLTELDGAGLLDEIQAAENGPKAIIISALSGDEVVRRASEHGAYYYFVKPFNMDRLYAIIEECVLPFDHEVVIRPKEPVKSLDERIANVFLAVGIPAHIKGYHYLREAVRLVHKDRAIINCITKKLYPGVAEIFDTSPSKVERAIRHAIEVSWSRGKIENINEIFGYTIYNRHEKPTNGEFIALVADKLITDDLTRAERDDYLKR